MDGGGFDEAERLFDARAIVAESVLREGSEAVTELSPRAAEAVSSFTKRRVSPSILTAGLRGFDLLVCVGGALITSAFLGPRGGTTEAGLLFGAIIGGVLMVLLIQALDGYQIATLKRRFTNLARGLGAWCVAWALALNIVPLVDIALKVPRDVALGWLLVTGGVMLVSRFVISIAVLRWSQAGALNRRAVIVGGGSSAEELIREMQAQPDSDITICGIFDDRSDERSAPIVAGYPKLGNIAELVEFGRRTRLDMLIVSLPLSAENRVLELLRRLWVLPVDIHLSAHADRMRFRQRSLQFVGTAPLLDVFERPLADWDALMKRAFDLFASVPLLIALSPVMLLTALAVRLETPGPVLFRQRRTGYNNSTVQILKFRSMYVDRADADAKHVVTKGDARVTRVGRFIRKTSIDELPQLVNVVLGDLSLVGPRPHAVLAHTDNRLWAEAIDGYVGRHRIKPGITGWAQINGWRGEVDTDEKIRQRVAHDLYYIENWSILFDLYILLRTPLSLFNTKNAY
ncbi:MAG: undecaprenyl-phosphate glucose phosphotransferase [Pseudomonadota bacterium]